jgi:hypothetical protein
MIHRGLVGILACFALAQEPTLRVTTRVVEVGIVAETKDGVRTVLGAEDFAVFDGGRPEKIAFFNVPPRIAAPAARRALPPNSFSNRVEYASGVSSATVILFDGLNTHITDQAYARLRARVSSGSSPSTSRLRARPWPRVLLDFTSDPAKLCEALESFRGELTPPLDLPLYDPAIPAPAHFHSGLGTDVRPDRSLRRGPRLPNRSNDGLHSESPGTDSRPQESDLGFSFLISIDLGAAVPGRRGRGIAHARSHRRSSAPPER